jgi:DNA-binding PadR family transcriptional regulator
MHEFSLDPRLFPWRAMSRGGPPGGGGGGGRGGGRGHGHRHGRHGGPGAWGFQGWGPPRGPRARRGDVRAALLVLLAEEPRNGYQLMQAIGDRSDGVWTPSPGSVYPALQLLEDEGLVAREGEDRKAYALTDEGRAYVESHADELGTPWDDVKRDVGQGAWDLMNAMRQIGMALFQIAQGGTEAQQAEAKQVLDETRKRLYRILADDEA